MNQIEIGGVQHPLLFNMTAIESVMEELNAKDFTELGAHINNAMVSKSLKFTRICAFHGICAGYRKEKRENPFNDIDDLADAVTSFYEVEPAMMQFMESMEEFFKPKKSAGQIKQKPLGESKRKKANP